MDDIYVTHVTCFHTLTNSQDHTAAIKNSIYRQMREKTLSQDQIQLTVQNTECDIDLSYFYNNIKGVGI